MVGSVNAVGQQRAGVAGGHPQLRGGDGDDRCGGAAEGGLERVAGLVLLGGEPGPQIGAAQIRLFEPGRGQVRAAQPLPAHVPAHHLSLL